MLNTFWMLSLSVFCTRNFNKCGKVFYNHPGLRSPWYPRTIYMFNTSIHWVSCRHDYYLNINQGCSIRFGQSDHGRTLFLKSQSAQFMQMVICIKKNIPQQTPWIVAFVAQLEQVILVKKVNPQQAQCFIHMAHNCSINHTHMLHPNVWPHPLHGLTIPKLCATVL